MGSCAGSHPFHSWLTERSVPCREHRRTAQHDTRYGTQSSLLQSTALYSKSQAVANQCECHRRGPPCSAAMSQTRRVHGIIQVGDLDTLPRHIIHVQGEVRGIFPEKRSTRTLPPGDWKGNRSCHLISEVRPSRGCFPCHGAIAEMVRWW